MALIKKTFSWFVLALAAGLATVLFYSEEAAQPGPLRKVHAELATCSSCHEPWKGARNSACRQCHFFGNVQKLRPELLFHEAKRHCLECHTEHQGRKGDIADMDHTLLHPDLQCSRCHLDPHAGLFGENCRECHGIASWTIESFQHPSRERKKCRRCHQAPRSHHDPGFKTRILQTHEQVFPGGDTIVIEDCWRCHITQDWRHLLMSHDLETK